jgi:hypothetical protein
VIRVKPGPCFEKIDFERKAVTVEAFRFFRGFGGKGVIPSPSVQIVASSYRCVTLPWFSLLPA